MDEGTRRHEKELSRRFRAFQVSCLRGCISWFFHTKNTNLTVSRQTTVLKQKKTAISRPDNGFAITMSTKLNHYQASGRQQGYNNPYYTYNANYDADNGLWLNHESIYFLSLCCQPNQPHLSCQPLFSGLFFGSSRTTTKARNLEDTKFAWQLIS